MNALLTFLCDGVRADLGYPARLTRLIAERPDIIVSLPEQTQNIAASSVVRWDILGRPSIQDSHRRPPSKLLGWRTVGGHFESFFIERLEFEQLGQEIVQSNWHCDITAVDGFSASKSDLTAFRTTDEMVETNSREMIDAITSQKLAENLAHKEIRIIHGEGDVDYFVRFAWDDRLFLMNSGGSHHFASAKYIAARLNRAVTLTGELRIRSLNEIAVATLRRDFEMFVISEAAEIQNEFYEAMRHFKATWLWTRMPHPFSDASRAILLPRNEARSMRVAESLREAGVLDLGNHLAGLCAKQELR